MIEYYNTIIKKLTVAAGKLQILNNSDIVMTALLRYIYLKEG
jgi:hypothetical protein